MANVCFVTDNGLRFFSLAKEQCEQLSEVIADLAAQREDGVLYRFVVSMDGGEEFTCSDVLVEYAVGERNRGRS